MDRTPVPPSRDRRARRPRDRAALRRGARHLRPGVRRYRDRAWAAGTRVEASRIVTASAAAVPGVRYVALRDLLCDARRCRTGGDGMPFYIDPQHLSRAGAVFVLARVPGLP